MVNATREAMNSLRSRPQPLTPIATDMFIPNLSGDHSKGHVNKTPVNNLDIVNKAYVDTLFASGVTGSGVNGRVALWTGTNSLGSNTDFEFNTSNGFTLTVGSPSSIDTNASLDIRAKDDTTTSYRTIILRPNNESQYMQLGWNGFKASTTFTMVTTGGGITVDTSGNMVNSGTIDTSASQYKCGGVNGYTGTVGASDSFTVCGGIIVDVGAPGCSGTPIDCSSASSQAQCEGISGCTANIDGDCHDFDADQTTCTNTAGCTVNFTECSAWDADSTSCTDNGCSFDDGDRLCSDFSNTDQGTCEANSGCTWSDPDCTGTYNVGSSCYGTSTQFNNCSGNYYSGCSGTADGCGTYSDKTSCESAGCTWS